MRRSARNGQRRIEPIIRINELTIERHIGNL
jgi:hypothetical protein